MGLYDMHGGVFSPLGYTRIDAGGSHEQNPYGGVQLGVDPNGIPNMVEEDEVVYDDYVYSDNINATEEILVKHNLPKKYAGKLFSEIADAVISDIGDMTTDEIALRGMKVHLTRLAEAQEEQKQLNEQAELEKELESLSPEELAELEAMLAQQEGGQQTMQPDVEAPGLMSFGGSVRRFDVGGPTNEERAAALISSLPDTAPMAFGAGQNTRQYGDEVATLRNRAMWAGRGLLRAMRQEQRAERNAGNVNPHDTAAYKQTLVKTYGVTDYARKRYKKAKEQYIAAGGTDDLDTLLGLAEDAVMSFNDQPQATTAPRTTTAAPAQRNEKAINFDWNNFALGGKMNTFADGGRIEDDQLAAWQEFMGLMNSYADDALAGRLTKFGGKKSVKALEDSAEYRAFTQYVLNNPGDPWVNMYLHLLDEQTSGKAKKLFGENGKLSKDWRNTFYRRRTDGIDGVYHYSGKNLSGLGAIGRGNYSYAAVDNDYANTDELDPKYVENLTGSAKGTARGSNTGTASRAQTSSSRKSSSPQSVAAPVAPLLSDDINIPQSEIIPEDISFSGGAPLAVSPMAYRFPRLSAASRMLDPNLRELTINQIPAAPELSGDIQIPEGDIAVESQLPAGLSANDIALSQIINGISGRARYAQPASAVSSPYAGNVPAVNLADYDTVPDDETLNEDTPRYRMPAIPATNPVAGMWNPESLLGGLPRRGPVAPVDWDYWNSQLPETGFTDASELLEFERLRDALAARGERLDTPTGPLTVTDPSYAGEQAEPYEAPAPSAAGRQGIAPNVGLGLPGFSLGPANTTLNFGSRRYGQEGTDWRRYADAGRNLAMGIYNMFQPADELNIPVAPNRYVDSPIPNFIDPVYRPTDPNLVVGDVLSSGAGAARGILASGNPITAGANLTYLNGAINSGVGRARTQVDASNNERLNSVITAKNNNILQRSNAMYQNAMARANHLAALDQFNIANNISGQKYKHRGEANWAQAVSQPLGAVTKFLQDDYLEDRRRNLAAASSIYGYWVDENGNRHYTPIGLVEYNG